jgi:hypothetical protein
MTFMRDIVRTGYLQPYFSLESLPVVPQYGPMFLFLFALLAGLATIGWLVWKAVSSLRERKI